MPVEMSQTADNYENIKIAVQAIGYIVTWLIVLVGWRVNNRQNQNRDERKELRDQINDIAEVIRNVEADVVAYLTTGDGTSTASYWTVYLGVRRVHSTIVRDQVFKTKQIETALIEYRQAITDRAMPGPAAPAKNPAELDKDLRQVSKCGNALIKALEERYSEKYPRKD
jgi:hypothetical protein